MQIDKAIPHMHSVDYCFVKMFFLYSFRLFQLKFDYIIRRIYFVFLIFYFAQNLYLLIEIVMYSNRVTYIGSIADNN